MNTSFKVLLFFALVGIGFPQRTNAQRLVVAQAPDFQEYFIEQISLEQGLSQGMVFSMIQDHRGYIWAATKEGLNRYDGTGFKVFRHKADDSLSISGNVVQALAQDNKQRLWAGTSDNGLNLFDPATESFIHFKHEPGNPKSIPSDNISVVGKNANGNLIYEMPEQGHLVITEKPVKHENLQDAFEFKPIEAVYPQLKNTLKDRFAVARLNFSSGGDLWYYVNDTICGYTAAMLRSGSAALKFHYPAAENVFYMEHVPFFFDTKHNRTFITSFGNVLKQFDPASKTFVPVLQLPAGYSFHHSIFIDNENNVWSWQPDNSLIKVNLTDGKMTVINLLWEKVNRGAVHPSDFTFEDMHGSLWLRSAGYGIFKISARNKLFKQLHAQSPPVGRKTWCYRIEQTGAKASFNPKALAQLVSSLRNIKLKGKEMLFPNHYINFALDKKGLFWIPSYHKETDNNTIAAIDPETATYKEFRDSLEVGSHYYGSPVFLDNSGGVWFGERISKKGINLYHVNQNENKIEAFPFPVPSNHDEHQFIADYFQDADGLFWLATRQGVFAFHPQTKQWQHFVNKPGDASSLSKDLVLSLCPDPAEPKRYIWVGTEGGGLNKFDIRKKTFTRFDVKDGLPNDVIYGIQSDAHHNLWISTNNGICQFNPKTLNTRNFAQADGLVSNEFNRYEFSKAADGTLYFGSPSGVTYFQPEDFYKKGNPSAVVINKLELLNKEVVYQHQQSPGQNEDFRLSAPIEHCKELVFNYDHRMITLGFAVLDFTTPKQNRFKYMLEGLDKDWIEAGTKSEATYTNLSPGSYTFKVLGCNSNNLWSSQPATLKICVQPPWWGTWWFRTLMAIVFVGFLYALYRYRLSKALELERVRNRIAQDLHDEIGSTLSSISLYSAAIQKNPNGLSPQNYSILNKISQSTTKMMEGMNDMVWTIKADNDNFEHVVNRMRAFAVNMTEAKDIQLHFNADAYTQKLLLNMEQRKNIYLIFKEAVNNAVKYSGCRNLRVSIKHHAGKLEMTIEDDGEGFEPEAVTQSNLMGGNGLKSMKLRAKNIEGILNIDTQESNGTRIVFSMLVH